MRQPSPGRLVAWLPLQAKGILMERYKIDAQKAFALLVRASQNRNVKLRDLAIELTDTGRIAGVTPPRPRS